MNLKEYFYTIFKSLNPESYEELVLKPIGTALRYFLFITIFSMIIMLILFIPFFLGFQSFADSKISNYGKMQINYSFELKQPFNLVDDPLIRVANGTSTLTDERMLISDEGIFYRQFFFFGKTVELPIEKNLDIAQSAGFKNGISKAMVFLLPSLFFWAFIFFFTYFLAIVVLTFVAALIFARVFRLAINWASLLKCSIYASTILISLQLILLPFYRIIFIPVIAYWILMILVLLLFKDKPSAAGKTLYSGKSHHKPEAIDVDSKGNLKTGRRKKSYEEENDGFVELK